MLLRRLRLRSLCLALAVFASGGVDVAFTAQGRFEPARKLTGRHTDRNLIDVEVVASSGSGPDARFLEPKRSLKLRLERAYVVSIGWRERPEYDFSYLSMTFDSSTGLPSTLFAAPLRQEDKRRDDVVTLSHHDLVRRTLVLSIDGSSSSDIVINNSAKLAQCRGEPEANELFGLNPSASPFCHLSSLLGQTNYVATLPNGISTQITCTDQAIGCRLTIPFEAFAPVIGFHRDRLPEWRSVANQATEFLQSRKYLGE